MVYSYTRRCKAVLLAIAFLEDSVAGSKYTVTAKYRVNALGCPSLCASPKIRDF